jgi:ribosomal protein S18 acetylase RimI-like enzyme
MPQNLASSGPFSHRLPITRMHGRPLARSNKTMYPAPSVRVIGALGGTTSADLQKAMTRIQVKPFRMGQEALVAQIHNTGFAEWMRELEGCYRYSKLTPERVLDWNQTASGSLWIAYVDGTAVGYVSYSVRREHGKHDFVSLRFDVTHPDWGQSRIAVVPEYRRKGVATALLRAVLDSFKMQGGTVAVALAYSFNGSASTLFSKAGFINHELFYFEPYSDREPWSFDSIYAEIDLTKPLKEVPLNPMLKIRPPQADDIGAFLNLCRRSAPFAFGPNPSPRQIDEWLSNPNSEAILVAEFDGKVIGAMEFFRDGVIGIPGILPEHRNSGFGTTLFYHLLKKMQLHGQKKAIGDTGVIQEEMLRMYRRFGFDLSQRLLNWVKAL